MSSEAAPCPLLPWDSATRDIFVQKGTANNLMAFHYVFSLHHLQKIKKCLIFPILHHLLMSWRENLIGLQLIMYINWEYLVVFIFSILEYHNPV
jgi:hypothetical protein